MRSCVVVADANRARLFVGNRHIERGASALNLREVEALENSSLRASGDGSSSKSSHGDADQRDKHRVEMDRHFATKVAAATVRTLRRLDAGKLVLVAPPRMLGLLRIALSAEVVPSVIRVELPKDLSRFSAERIRDVLTQRDIVITSEHMAPSAEDELSS